MNRNNFLLGIGILLAIPAVSQSDFQYQRKINGIDREDWYSIALTPEIFDHVDHTFSDIRLFSFSGKDTTEIPYFLKVHSNETMEPMVELPVVTKGKKDGNLYITFELDRSKKVNYINLKFQEGNFFGFINLEGSHDQHNWFELAGKQRILSIQNDTENYQASGISFAYADYRFLRVSIQSDTALTFLSAYVRDRQTKKGTFITEPAILKVQQNKAEKKTLVDITFQHRIPVKMLSLSLTSNQDYYRQFFLEYISDSTKTQKGWIYYYQPVLDGYLTSYSENILEISDVFAKQLRLTIKNEDNAPLAVNRVEAYWPATELIARLKPSETFLFYGSPTAGKPAYDIEHFREKIPEVIAPVTLSEEQNIDSPITTPSFLIENTLWLWAVIILMIVVLGFFTLRMMRSSHSS